MRTRYRAAVLGGTLCLAFASGGSGANGDCGSRSEYVRNERIDAEERCRLEAWALETGTSALVISVGGRVVFELETERSSEPIHIMSVTKSVAGLAVGALLEDGALDSLDLELQTLFPEWRQGNKKTITLRHLMTHSTGIQDLTNAGIEIEPAEDVVRLALAAELTEMPGEKFRYNNKASNLLGAVVERLTGEKIDDYVERKIFASLGIKNYRWLRDEAGNPYSMAGLFLTARDLDRVGRLVNRGGVWDGRRLLPDDYVDQALSAQRDDNEKVGLLWWRVEGEPPAYQANGWLGQWLIGYPALDVVVVRLVDRADAVKSDGQAGFLELVSSLVADP